MVTGYEVKMYRDIEQIAQSQRSIAKSLERIATVMEAEAGKTDGEDDS